MRADMRREGDVRPPVTWQGVAYQRWNHPDQRGGGAFDPLDDWSGLKVMSASSRCIERSMREPASRTQ